MSLVAPLHDYFIDSNGIWRVIGSVALILLAWLLEGFLRRLVRRFFRRLEANADAHAIPRLELLASLTVRAIRFAIIVVAADLVLLDLGVIRASFSLTSLGVASVVVGIALQPLVKDHIYGFFIITEGQYGPGDTVTIAGLTGTVVDVSLRRTLLRGASGELLTVPHSLVDKTTNLSRGEALAQVDVRVNYADPAAAVLAAISGAAGEVAANQAEQLKEAPNVLGIVELGEKSYAIRVLAKCKPAQHWSVERELRRQIKLAFEREGFRVPWEG